MEEIDAEASKQAYVLVIKQFRKDIDANIQKAEELLKDYPTEVLHISCARELSLVRTKLQEAKMWGGKILEVLGTPYPAELADKAE